MTFGEKQLPGVFASRDDIANSAAAEYRPKHAAMS
jgi:hypothetical protein